MIKVFCGILDITQIVTKPIKIEDDYSTGCISCSFDFVLDPRFKLENEKIIFIKVKDEIWFEGVITNFKKNKKGKGSLTAHDPFFYLIKSKDDLEFRKKSSKQILNEIFTKAQMKIVEICDMSYVFERLLFLSQDYDSLMSVILTVIHEDSKRTGKKYWLRYEKGVRLFERKPPARVPLLNTEVEDIEYSESMEGMFTSVKVVDREKNIIVTQKKDRPGKYVLNTVEEYSAKNEADAIRYAKQKLTEHCQVTKSRSIKKIFDYTVPRFFSGDFVYIPDPGEEEILGFYFKKISYDLHNSYVSLSADLGYTAYLPPLAYKDPEKKEEEAE